MNVGEQRKRRPASECIWYVLATIAGEPNKTANPVATIQRNREYWNALMQTKLGPSPEVEDASGQNIRLPEWTEEHLYTALDVLDARGFSGVQIPDLNGAIDFSYVNFPEDTRFDGFVFGGPTTFKGARFGTQSQSFNDAVFVELVTFEEAEFRGEFSGSGMNFSEHVDFSEAKFRSDARFEDTRFRDTSRFNGATFEGQARFERCAFGDAAMFRDTEFRDIVNFNQVDIQGSCVFLHARFNGSVPAFFGATLPEYTLWHGAKWPGVPKGANEALYQAQGYQRLARMMNSLEKFDEQRMFVRQEMRARRWVDGRFPGSMNLAYSLICDYGYGLPRAARWWLAHMLSGGVALCISKSIASMDQAPTWHAIRESFAGFGSAMLLSFGNAHGFLDLNRKFFETTRKAWEDVPGFEGIGAAQTVVGVIILFLLLLTIRNRFRMR